MADPISLSALNYFMPIAAFLLVFVVIYAILAKTKVLGESHGMLAFIALVMAGFFVVEASLVEFVQFSSAWFGVLVVAVFFITLLVAFMPGDNPLKEILGKGNWFGFVLIGAIVAIFIIASSYVFNWAINWAYVWSWTNTEWFGMVLLIVVAGIVAIVIKGKSG